MKLNNVFFPLFALLWLGCKTPYVVSSHDEKLYTITNGNQADSLSAIEQLLKPYRDSVSGIMGEIIGQASGDFRKEKGVGSLDNFVADAVYSSAKQINPLCMAAIYNPGGIRIPDIKKGSITRGKMFELLPFENELVILELKGAVLEQWMNAIGDAGGWPMSKTLDVHFNSNNKVTSISQESLLSNTNNGMKSSSKQFSIEPDAIYHIATNDYIANGGDHCDFLKGIKRINTGLLIRDILIEVIKKQQTISPDEIDRIHFDK